MHLRQYGIRFICDMICDVTAVVGAITWLLLGSVPCTPERPRVLAATDSQREMKPLRYGSSEAK
jgi:hypothetical protein